MADTQIMPVNGFRSSFPGSKPCAERPIHSCTATPRPEATEKGRSKRNGPIVSLLFNFRLNPPAATDVYVVSRSFGPHLSQPDTKPQASTRFSALSVAGLLFDPLDPRYTEYYR